MYTCVQTGWDYDNISIFIFLQIISKNHLLCCWNHTYCHYVVDLTCWYMQNSIWSKRDPHPSNRSVCVCVRNLKVSIAIASDHECQVIQKAWTLTVSTDFEIQLWNICTFTIDLLIAMVIKLCDAASNLPSLLITFMRCVPVTKYVWLIWLAHRRRWEP